MSSSDRFEPSATKPELSYTDSVYRCVCGQLLEIESAKETKCPQCDRAFSAGFLEDESGEETLIATLCERRTKIVYVPGEEDPLIDQTWGHFKIIEALGRGGMGTVYRALDESLQRYVALKVILTAESGEDDTKQVQQLFQEARAQARVNHPNVVHIYFVDRSHGSPFFAMELVNGPTLKDRLDEGPLSFSEVIRVALQVAGALRHALKYDIVHGDIKPSNLLQSESGDVKISDFGLARRLSEIGSEGGVLAGTPNYLSPESAARSSTDFRSDLYSLGVTLFEFTFGKLPYSFETKSVEERLKAHQFKPVEFPEVWPEGVPTIWRNVLERLLAKDREQRYQTYDELISDLEDAKPLSVPSAGLIPRGMAWLVDVLLLLIVTVILFLPVKLGALVELLGDQPVLEWLIRLIAAFGVPAVAISYQWLRGTTPGKELFQLRVVDSHGAAASRSQIAYRTGMQFLFLWTASVLGVLDELGIEMNGILTGLIVLVPLLIEMGDVVFSKKGLALHDRLFRTRVVLDARDSSD
jgi:uncharacterized RDD family membrane protein YckC